MLDAIIVNEADFADTYKDGARTYQQYLDFLDVKDNFDTHFKRAVESGISRFYFYELV